jgi:hypothetical protein
MVRERKSMRMVTAMKTTSPYDLRDAILALSDAERANLLALVEVEEAARPFRATRADLDLWNALVRLAVHNRHRSLDGFLRDKHQGVSRAAWSDAVNLLADFAAEAKPVRHADEDRTALVNLALECLVSDMELRGVEVTPRRIIESLPRLRTAIDTAFPGWRDSGLLHMLIRLAPVIA